MNALLLPLIVAAILFKRLFKPHQMYLSDIQPLPSWQNKVLYRIFSSERVILRRCTFPMGASLLLVAQPANGS